MKCVNHVENEAYAACDRCGAVFCYECAEKTSPAKSQGYSLCPDCYREFVRVNMESHRKSKAKYIGKMILEICLLVIGAIVAIPAILKEGSPDYITMLQGFAIIGAVGIIDAIKGQKKKEDEYEKKHGAEYTGYVDPYSNSVRVVKDQKLVEKFIFRLLAIMIAVFIAPLATTVRIIGYISKIKYYSKGIKFCEYEIQQAYV